MKLAALALALAVSFAASQDSDPPPKSIGFNRHAQLLEASLDGRGRLVGRYVTVGNVIAPDEPDDPFAGALEVRDLSERGRRLARLEIDAQLLPLETFTSPPRFRYFAGLRGADRALVIDSEGRLSLLRIEDGQFEGSASVTTAIHDAIAVDGDVLVLPRFEQSIGHFRFSPPDVDGSGMNERAVTGAFVRSAEGGDGEFVLVKEIDGELVVELRAPDCSIVTRRGLGPDVAPPDRATAHRLVRCDARREGASLLVAISDPHHGDLVGRIIACDLLAEDGPALLWDGRPWPALQGDMLDQSAFGHVVELLPDFTGDDVPEIATTTPTRFLGTPGVHVLDGRTGAIVTEETLGLMDRTGADLSLDPTGRFLMVTVLPHGYPEDLTKVARVQVLRVPTEDRPTLERVR